MNYYSNRLKGQLPVFLPVTSVIHVLDCPTFVAWEVLGRLVKTYEDVEMDNDLPNWLPFNWLSVFLTSLRSQRKFVEHGWRQHANRLSGKVTWLKNLPSDTWEPFQAPEVAFRKYFRRGIIALTARVDWLAGVGSQSEGVKITQLYDFKFPRTVEKYEETTSYRFATYQLSTYALMLEGLGCDVDELRGAVVVCDQSRRCEQLPLACLTCPTAHWFTKEVVDLSLAQTIVKRSERLFEDGFGVALSRSKYKKAKKECLTCQHAGGCQMELSEERLETIVKGWVKWRKDRKRRRKSN